MKQDSDTRMNAPIWIVVQLLASAFVLLVDWLSYRPPNEKILQGFLASGIGCSILQLLLSTFSKGLLAYGKERFLALRLVLLMGSLGLAHFLVAPAEFGTGAIVGVVATILLVLAAFFSVRRQKRG